MEKKQQTKKKIEKTENLRKESLQRFYFNFPVETHQRK